MIENIGNDRGVYNIVCYSYLSVYLSFLGIVYGRDTFLLLLGLGLGYG